MRMSFRPSWRDPRFREEARAGIQEIQGRLDSRFRGNDDRGPSDYVIEILRDYTGMFS